MKHSHLVLRGALLAALALPVGASSAHDGADWARWRGPLGTGVAPDSDPPMEWNETTLRWKVAIPGLAHSSPIVHGNRVYVMTAVETDAAAGLPPFDLLASPPVGLGAAVSPARAAQDDRGRGRGRGGGRGMNAPKPTKPYEFIVMALDRGDGSVAWRTTVRKEVPHEGIHPTGSFASGTPVTDGKHVYAFFGSRGLFCLDMDGAVKWEKDLGDMRTRNSFGEGASPALHGDTLVVPWDHEGDSFVAAFDAATGAERWRVARQELTSWTTPLIAEVNGAAQAIIAGKNATISYDLATGAEVWRCSGMTMNVVPTPMLGHGLVYLMSGFRGSALQAIKLEEARGDISGSNAIAWTHARGTPYIPSPLLSGRNLYFLRGTNGIISCFDALTGEAHYGGERLENVASVYASIVGGGGRIFICGREGDVAVVEDGPTFKVLGTGNLGEGIDATPAIVGREVFVRGSKHLFCFATPEG